MSKQLYIFLPTEASDQSVPALVRHALTALVNDAGSTGIDLVHFDLVHPTHVADRPSVFVEMVDNSDVAQGIDEVM
jgi:hypothetical protein